MTKQDQIKQLIHRYMASWNAHDAEAVAATFITGGLYEDTAMQVTFTDNGIAEYAQAAFEHCPDIQFGFTRDISIVSENRVVLQTIMSGHRSHDGSYSEVELAEFIELSGDKIKAIKVYYDNEAEDRAANEWFKEHENREKPKNKYQRSGMDGKQLIMNKLQLIELMEQGRAFADNEVTMPKLAEQMGISNNHLSQVINSQFNMNFFDFINYYRIQESKNMLSSSKSGRKDSVLDIALSVGFNSTSTFYSAFKKFSGTTPAQYKKSI